MKKIIACKNLCFGNAISRTLGGLTHTRIDEIQAACKSAYTTQPFLLPQDWQYELKMSENMGSGYCPYNIQIFDYYLENWPENAQFLHIYVSFQNGAHIFSIEKLGDTYRLDDDNFDPAFCENISTLLSFRIASYVEEELGLARYIRVFWYSPMEKF